MVAPHQRKKLRLKTAYAEILSEFSPWLPRIAPCWHGWQLSACASSAVTELSLR